MDKQKWFALGIVLTLLAAAAISMVGVRIADAQLTQIPAVMGNAVSAGTTDFEVQVPAGFYDLTISVTSNEVKLITLPEIASAPWDSVPIGASEVYTADDIYISGFKVDRTSSAAVKWILEKAGR